MQRGFRFFQFVRPAFDKGKGIERKGCFRSVDIDKQGKGDDLARFPVSRRVMGESMKGKNCRVALLKPIPDDEDIRGAAVRPQAAVVDI